MNLIELLIEYQQRLREGGRKFADERLLSLGVSESIRRAISVCFNDAGESLKWDGSVRQFF